jgi:transcriptional regulator GlxA family with amidase domain
MDRRAALSCLIALAAAAPASATAGQPGAQPRRSPPQSSLSESAQAMHSPARSETLVLIAYPQMTALDLLGPHHMLASLTGAKVLIAAETSEPVVSDLGLKILPDVSFEDCPREVDLFLVPGGTRGTTAAMQNPKVLALVRELGEKSRFVTSVCTGSLILGAAGLLDGYRATSHWVALPLLKEFNAIPVSERVVFDRNRITGAGVTAGMDMALAVVKMLRGEPYAKLVALTSEYAPEPPVRAGSPEEAGADATEHMRGMFARWVGEAEKISRSSPGARRT